MLQASHALSQTVNCSDRLSNTEAHDVCSLKAHSQHSLPVLSHCTCSSCSGDATAGSLVKERVVFEDSLMGSQYISNAEGIPEQAYHTALATTSDRMLLLTSQGAAFFHLDPALNFTSECLYEHLCRHCDMNMSNQAMTLRCTTRHRAFVVTNAMEQGLASA